MEWIAIVVVTIALVLPIVWGEPREIAGESGGDPWRNTILDFQTLITGGLALWAAKMTVRQMIKSDVEQDARHREAIDLALRSDKRKIERALNPQQYELQGAQQGFREILSNMLRRGNFADQLDALVDSREELLRLIHIAQRALGRPQFQEAKELLDGDLTRLLDVFHEAADEIVRLFAEPVPNVAEAWQPFSILATHLEGALLRLQLLREQYRIPGH